MKKIDKDFKPDERSYNNLRAHGAIPEFVDYELPNFITYWMETGGKKKSWQMTLQRWMRSAWQGKAGRDWEYNRHNRKDSGGRWNDMFGEIFADMMERPVEQIEQIQRNLKPYERPPTGPAMKPEDAFAQLRNSGVIK